MGWSRRDVGTRSLLLMPLVGGEHNFFFSEERALSSEKGAQRFILSPFHMDSLLIRFDFLRK